MADYVQVGILTPSRLASRDSGRRFLCGLLDAAPDWAPEKYNHFEPLRRVFDSAKLEEALDAWQWSFLWKRKLPTVTGSVFANQNAHGTINITVARREFDVATAVRLFRRLTSDFRVDLAYIHVPHDDDLKQVEYYQRHIMPYLLGMSTHALRKGLPGVPWGILFGPPYLAMIGRERLLSAPAWKIDEIDGGAYIQLTPDPTDVANDRATYLKLRQSVEAHLGSEMFVGQSSRTSPRVPEFWFSVH